MVETRAIFFLGHIWPLFVHSFFFWSEIFLSFLYPKVFLSPFRSVSNIKILGISCGRNETISPSSKGSTKTQRHVSLLDGISHPPFFYYGPRADDSATRTPLPSTPPSNPHLPKLWVTNTFLKKNFHFKFLMIAYASPDSLARVPHCERKFLLSSPPTFQMVCVCGCASP